MVELISNRIFDEINKFIKAKNPLVFRYFKSKYPKLNNEDLFKIIECRLKSITLKELYHFSYAYLQFKIIIYTVEGVYSLKINIELIDTIDDIFRRVNNVWIKMKLHSNGIYTCIVHELNYRILK